MLKLLQLILFSSLVTISKNSLAAIYQDGDIIFQESQSSQSFAIKEATNSKWSHVGILFNRNGRWYVAEAVQPVHATTLSSFIAKGKNKSFKVYRYPGLTKQQQVDLRNQVSHFIGKNYDIYFEWSDYSIYCSELVYKVFLSAIGVEIGQLQRFIDLRLDGPYVKDLIQRRLTDTGRALDPNEPIVTPASQIQDKKLLLIDSSN